MKESKASGFGNIVGFWWLRHSWDDKSLYQITEQSIKIFGGGGGQVGSRAIEWGNYSGLQLQCSLASCLVKTQWMLHLQHVKYRRDILKGRALFCLCGCGKGIWSGPIDTVQWAIKKLGVDEWLKAVMTMYMNSSSVTWINSLAQT